MNGCRFSPLVALLVLAGCTVGPQYKPPAAPVASRFHAALPAGEAADATRLANWWQQFDEPLLSELVSAAEKNSPTLSQAVARIEQARASTGTADAAKLPTLDANLSLTREGSKAAGASKTKTTVSKSLDASWEIDLFGGKRKAAEAAYARLAAQQANWHVARISLAAETAATYVNLRSCQQRVALVQQDLDSRQQSARLTHSKIEGGFAAAADGLAVDAGLAAARERLTSQRVTCELQIKALVELTGLDEAPLRDKLSMANSASSSTNAATAADPANPANSANASATDAANPANPANPANSTNTATDMARQVTGLPSPRLISVNSVPAQTLAQRPDIAAAELELRAASFDINVAEANRYPQFSLTGSIGNNRIRNGASTDTWSIIPALTQPLFDAGARKAEVQAAQGRLAEAQGLYQQRVRAAVREIEETLVRLEGSAARETDSLASLAAQQRYFVSTGQKTAVGHGSQFEVESARRDLLNAQLLLLDARQERISAWISLYKALGGGWQAAPAAPN